MYEVDFLCYEMCVLSMPAQLSVLDSAVFFAVSHTYYISPIQHVCMYVYVRTYEFSAPSCPIMGSHSLRL